MWFGEFIHAVMEETYLEWRNAQSSFPRDWQNQIRPLEVKIAQRLMTRGLVPPFNLFCRYGLGPSSTSGECFCKNVSGPGPHQLLASRRAEAAINAWGPHLFPLITQAQVQLSGLRPLPQGPREVVTTRSKALPTSSAKLITALTI